MSYIGITIKSAMEKINNSWFLPAIQRPYVWGSRYDSEKYICKLFDSLFQSYPIGGLIMWQTNSKVAHREFLKDFHQGDVYNNVEEGLYERDKCLIYDGQQRLQTLYSCLKYTFNDRVLVFDLSYNANKDTDSDTGFRFIGKNDTPNPFEVKMNRIFSMSTDVAKKRSLRIEFCDKIDDEEIKAQIEVNLDQLWNIFVESNVNSLAYFSIQSENEDKVNEIFERLNTGGIPLSKADLLFYRIKGPYPNFESEIMNYCKRLTTRTHLGIESYDVLQILNLIVRGRSRIDDNVTKEQIELFKNEWDHFQYPMDALFDDYLRAHLHISHMAIIRNKMPLLVLAVFFHEFYKAGHKYRNMSPDTLKLIDRFFITAEINDWALQSYTDNFTRIIKENPSKEQFPFDLIVDFVRWKGNRMIDITESMFVSYRWMALKFMMPHRDFEFDYTMLNRFNPELDHIFPTNLTGGNDDYKAYVDTIWNMQPVKGECNNLKSNINPKDFFSDIATRTDGTPIFGSKFFELYDFVPCITDPLWDDYKSFIDNRRQCMLDFFKKHYGIEIKTTQDVDEEKLQSID